jgi:hypothetical protein
MPFTKQSQQRKFYLVLFTDDHFLNIIRYATGYGLDDFHRSPPEELKIDNFSDRLGLVGHK